MTGADWFRWIGGLLQLAGVLTIVMSVLNTRHHVLGRTPVRHLALARLRAGRQTLAQTGSRVLTWLHLKKMKTVAGAATAHVGVTSRVTTTRSTTWNVDAIEWDTITDREAIGHLREIAKLQVKRIEKAEQATSAETLARDRALKVERQHTEQRISEMVEEAVSITGGKMKWEVAGALCFFVGIALSTWAAGFATWF